MATPTTDYDVLIVGSGFGGSVTALRLVEKGYRVGILESGRRFADDEFAKTSWDLRRFLWAPKLGCFGIQRVHLLHDVLILAGAGVGGGSLNYANTLYKPPGPFFADKQWSHITDWFDELSPHYEQARKMLGVVRNPHMTPADEIIKSVADDMGVGDTFIQTPVGVFFGEPGKTVPDPYFGGVGPERTGCIECGECMTGCRHGAKNTLLKNYLGLAEKAGAEILPLTTVTAITPHADGSWDVVDRADGGVDAQAPAHLLGGTGRVRGRDVGNPASDVPDARRGRAAEAVPAPGRADPHQLRVDRRCRQVPRRPRPRPHQGRGDHVVLPPDSRHAYRTGPLRQGLQCDGHAADADGRRRWTAATLAEVRPARAASSDRHAADAQRPQNWSERTIIALVMQNLDNSITTYTKRGLFGRRKVTSKQGHGQPNPTWIPVGNDATRRIAEKIDGIPGGTWGEIFNVPLTAHFLGGCAIGEDSEHGVIDPYHRVYGYPTLSVVDGASVSANLGVNPSLTICAQAERAASLWPNKGEADRRPAQGAGYRRLDPIAPRHPVVPAHAPAALSLPIAEIRGAG